MTTPRFMLSLLGMFALVACNRTESPPSSSNADTSVAEVPPPPESVAAHNEAMTHGPPICPRRPGSTLITSKGIGPAQLGMTLDSLAKLCTVRDSALREDEGQPANGRAISVGEGAAPVLLFIDEAKRTVRQAGTTDPFFRTTAGVGVGSLVSDVRHNHGKICADLGPTGVEIWAASLKGVVFGTTAFPPRMPGKGSKLKRDASAVPDTAQLSTVAVSTKSRPCDR